MESGVWQGGGLGRGCARRQRDYAHNSLQAHLNGGEGVLLRLPAAAFRPGHSQLEVPQLPLATGLIIWTDGQMLNGIPHLLHGRIDSLMLDPAYQRPAESRCETVVLCATQERN